MLLSEFLDHIDVFGYKRFVWLREGMDTIGIFPSDSELLTTYRNRLVNGIDIREFCDTYCYEVILKGEEEESNE